MTPTVRLTNATRVQGILFCAGATTFQALWLGSAAALLSAALVLALVLWLTTPWQARSSAVTAYRCGWVGFIAHVTEEFLTGFPRDYPALWDEPAWSATRYLTFNAVWGGLFLWSALQVRSQRPLAVLILLFFVVAGGFGNFASHLFLVVRSGHYFPGAATAPLLFISSVFIVRGLYGQPSAAE